MMGTGNYACQVSQGEAARAAERGLYAHEVPGSFPDP
jgi:hypothetical protein